MFMTWNIYVTRVIPQAGIDILKASGVKMEINPHDRPLTRKELLAEVRGRDGILCLLHDRIDKEVFDAADKTRGFANYAVGFNNVDVAEATRRKIPISNTPDVLTDATADLAFALLLSTARRIAEGDRIMR